MDWHFLIAVTKVLSAAIGGALGVAGLLLNFRKPDGTLSHSGLGMISGILASTLFGVLGSYLLDPDLIGVLKGDSPTL